MLYPLGDLTDANKEKPEPWATVKVHLPNGSAEMATWTGKVWWTYRGGVFPVKWQTVADHRMGAPVLSKGGVA